MDAVKFFEEYKRMCDSIDSCDSCPASGKCLYGDTIQNYTGVVAITEKWSKEHPRKTRQSVFLEQYPEARLDEYGVLLLCPSDISAAHRDSGGCKNTEKMCIDCRLEFWMQEVEDENKIECWQCQYLMFSDCYGECSKGNISGVVQPHFSCGKGVARNNPADKAIFQFREGHTVKRGGMQNEHSLRD